jgi:predicted dehydrogenase
MLITPPNRRHFLQSTAAGIAAPFILPSRVWSAETAPNSRLGLGFIGLGKMNSGHLRSFLSRPEVQILAVAEVDTNRRENAKKTVEQHYGKEGGYTGCGAYSDFRELLARKDIDAVVIATPDHWHAYISIAAMKAGKDVYCEKPLTHNIHEALAMMAAVKETGRVLQTGSQQRSNNQEFRVACELVRNGVLGKIQRVETQFKEAAKPNANKEEPMEPGLDWDMWCGPAPLAPYSSVLSPRGVHDHFPKWRETREYGGGYVCDWGAHHIDIAQWGLDEDEKGPVEIIAPENADSASEGAKLIYGSGIPLIHVNKGFGVSFFGENGEVHANRGKFSLKMGGKVIHEFLGKNETKGTSLDRELALTERELLKDANVKLYRSRNHHEDWIKAISSREKPICHVGIGASTVISCHLMNQAYYHGGTQKWDPQNHSYLSGGDASWLTRDYRGDWKV